MNGSFLRSSLFTSVLAYGVSLLALGTGAFLALIGWALMQLAKALEGRHHDATPVAKDVKVVGKHDDVVTTTGATATH